MKFIFISIYDVDGTAMSRGNSAILLILACCRLLYFRFSSSYMSSNFTDLIFMYLLQLPVADPFLEKVSLSDLGKYLNYYYGREKEIK